jgi:hypothetical protein
MEIELSNKVMEWVTSPKGQKDIQGVLEDSKEAISKLIELRKIDIKDIYEPFTL